MFEMSTLFRGGVWRVLLSISQVKIFEQIKRNYSSSLVIFRFTDAESLPLKKLSHDDKLEKDRNCHPFRVKSGDKVK